MIFSKKKNPGNYLFPGKKRRRPDLNRWILVLQTIALPLGYYALLNFIICWTISKNDSDGNRTRVTAVKGRCLNRLTTEPLFLFGFPSPGLLCGDSSPSFAPPDLSLHSTSPSRARTYNNSVNSRVLYHWAIEDYLFPLHLSITRCMNPYPQNRTLNLISSLSKTCFFQDKPSTD